MILMGCYYLLTKGLDMLKHAKRVMVGFIILMAVVNMSHAQGSVRSKKITSSGTITTGSAIELDSC